MARDEDKWRARRFWRLLMSEWCPLCSSWFVREPGWRVWRGLRSGPSPTYIWDPECVIRLNPAPDRRGVTFCAGCVPDEATALRKGREQTQKPPAPAAMPPLPRGGTGESEGVAPEAGTPDPFDMPYAERVEAFEQLGKRLGTQARKAMEDAVIQTIQKGRTDGQASA